MNSYERLAVGRKPQRGAASHTSALLAVRDFRLNNFN